jgi:hypothetical protein
MAHLAINRQHSGSRDQLNFSAVLVVTQKPGQMLTDEGNVDPSNAAALLHVLH